ncbi:major tail protein [Arthrobacter phage KeAlii]|uniref:Major tail protein n=1 Tax=Arthrobacter phage KeAlii TaxID=2885973 RepID=A0AA94WXV9_9CAUD|nr:major tail protein [Arthrobacter phage KeAlii]UDL14619.1 major tail protein [Arthrobacter phage KeAlii]
MAGDATNTALWTGADVYIAAEGTAGPADLTTAWGAGWDAAGLLDGEDGITETREGDSSDHYAWGGLLYRRTMSKHKRTFKFVALEDNDVTFDLVNPGSTRTTDGVSGVRTAKIKAPVAGMKFSVGFETRDGDKVKRRYAKHAEVVEVGEIKDSETEPTVYEITVVVYPEADGTLYTTVDDDPAVP